MTYFILVVFEDKNKWGKTLPNKYKRKFDAEKQFESLVNSGLYECVMIRKEEKTPYYFSSAPYKRWEVA
jgi:hypothetical protein